ncbi:DUF2281 domain-containing protein [Nostoc sp. CHAB 5834]|nr:DUF2281 domain-containing protein [Nostoc sp. CHAB 5834]
MNSRFGRVCQCGEHWQLSGIIGAVVVKRRHQLVDQALQTINQLPEDKISEIIDFASFVLKRYEEAQLRKGIERLAETSDAFAFLH